MARRSTAAAIKWSYKDISCPICYNFFMSEKNEGLDDRRPVFLCKKLHTVCFACAHEACANNNKCPIAKCNTAVESDLKVNGELLVHVSSYANKPHLPSTELRLEPRPFSNSCYCDLYKAKLHKRDVVVRILGRLIDLDKYRDRLEMEAKLAFSLNHPNIVQLLGMTPPTEQSISVVMEYGDQGSLAHESWLTKYQTDRDLVIRVSIGIVDGLEYLHSKTVAHRELKPSNILLVGPDFVPKISDFSVKKVIQMLVKTSDMIGKPKYMAPEIFEDGSMRGYEADVYSMAMIFYELFSGVPAERYLGRTVVEIIKAILKGTRPTIPSWSISMELTNLIVKGWETKPHDRPKLEKFRDELLSMMKFLHLENEDGVSCYANSLLQVFLAMDQGLFDGADAFSRIVKKFTAKESTDQDQRESSMDLRKLVGSPYANTGQEDVRDFLQDLVIEKHIPPQIIDCWSFDQIDNVRCLVCDAKPSSPGCVSDTSFLASQSKDGRQMKFKDFFKSERKQNCTQCEDQMNHEVKSKFRISAKTFKYFLMFNKTVYSDGNQCKMTRITHFNANSQKIPGLSESGFRFRAVAAVAYKSESGSKVDGICQGGHYTCWRRVPGTVNQWMEISDTKLVKIQPGFVADLRNIYLLVLERFETAGTSGVTPGTAGASGVTSGTAGASGVTPGTGGASEATSSSSNANETIPNDTDATEATL